MDYKNSPKSPWNRLLNSFRYAGRGLYHAWTTERNIRIHTGAAILVLIAAWLLNVSTVEWLLLLFVIGMVITLEMINTVIERVVDLVSPEKNELAGQAKDVAAGAVLTVATLAVIVGVIIFIPRVITLFY
ncbi:diacylglycerol kinase family protein [Texcoconibacillus texcoconensis]|uniref:Diacylglycerol kinase n=1 Tax=Texcoconibacillus texcoconensis TaxID=1095777 RepID=A0A840QRE7_9BACI|nr:diacylglycerol kinase family protein [Texcoconibacillus texcoconensis]MBB5173935.1 diacylglycerol kinase [Texcoconibacillus texcoconensis]